MKATGKDYIEKKVERKGEQLVYGGLALKAVLALVDDDAKKREFDVALWKKGYEITLTADVASDALILADTENGKPLAKPMVVGDAPKNLWVRDIAALGTSLAPTKTASEAPAFSLELDINGKKAAYTLAELEKDPAFIEAPGSFTTSAGTRYANR